MKKSKKRRHYGVQCGKCEEKLFSMWVHDFHFCKCGETFIDGGYDYVRCGWHTLRPKNVYRLEEIPKQKPIEQEWPYPGYAANKKRLEKDKK